MFDTESQIISALLESTIADLDIPPEMRAAAEEEYERVGGWLAEHADAGGDGWQVFPQGSFRLGTVVKPEGADEYDLDIVCRRQIEKAAITKVELKQSVGSALGSYVDAVRPLPGAATDLDERGRSWTLGGYALPFHLDVLPAVPNRKRPPTGICLTDRDLHEWQYSDPIAYAQWFHDVMNKEFLAKRLRLAEASHTPPEAIPAEQVKTTLQRVVQVLKHHRSLYFAEDLDSRPASILVTTLATQAYRGEEDLRDAIIHAATEMPKLIERDGERWVVENPVEPEENFADKWNARPELAERFLAWLRQLEADLVTAERQRGLDAVVASLQESFGREPMRKAAAEVGDRLRRQRVRGELALTGGGMLTGGRAAGSGETKVRDHTFYGD
jgi:hypothetical protein